MSLRVQLYMKSGCHLCEQAEADLRRLRPRGPHTLELVDITSDEELVRRYGERIPVLVVEGQEYSAPLPVAVLERALAEAAVHQPAQVRPLDSPQSRADSS